MNGIFYILRTGAPWRDLPKRYGPRTTYVRWALRGIWKAIFDALADQSADSLFFIESSIVKTHRAAAGAGCRGDALFHTTHLDRSGTGILRLQGSGSQENDTDTKAESGP